MSDLTLSYTSYVHSFVCLFVQWWQHNIAKWSHTAIIVAHIASSRKVV
jgi:hypothetical protein